MNTNMYLMKTEEGNQILRLAEDLEDVAAAYDYCVIDCGLIMDMTVMNALVAADLVIVPVKLGGFEIEAADNMDEQLESIRKFNDRIRMKVLITMRQKNKTTLQVVVERKFRTRLFSDSNPKICSSRKIHNRTCTASKVL